MRWRWPPRAARVALGQPVELHQLEQVHHLFFDLRFARALAAGLDAQAKGDVLEHRHVAEQRVVLEHKAHVALAHMHIGGVFAAEVDGAHIGRFQARDDAKQRGLAAARGPSKPQ